VSATEELKIKDPNDADVELGSQKEPQPRNSAIENEIEAVAAALNEETKGEPVVEPNQ